MGISTCQAATRARNRFKKRKALGVCTRCGNPRDCDSLTCVSCRDKAREHSKRFRAEARKTRTKLGICSRCLSRESMPGCVICAYCSEQNVEYTARKRAEWRLEGRCTSCGGKKPCERCRALAAARRVRYKASCVKNHKCIECNRRVERAGKKYCEACVKKGNERSSERRRRLRGAKNGSGLV